MDLKYFSIYLEENESILDSPSLFKEIFNQFEIPIYSDETLKKYENAISYLLLESIKSRLLINQMDMEEFDKLIENCTIKELQLKLLSKDEQECQQTNLIFNFIFETIKRNQPYNFTDIELILNVPFISLFKKSSKILSKKLFPNKYENHLDQNHQDHHQNKLENDKDKPEDLFNDEYMEDFYSNSPKYLQVIKFIGDLIKRSIEPLLFKKGIIRIIEFGGGTGTTSKEIFNTINKLIQQQEQEVLLEIEYTYSDVNPILIDKAKEEFKSKYANSNLKIIFRNLNLQKSIINQELLKNYYDIVVIENVLHFLKDCIKSLSLIRSILKVNGHLIINEPPYKSVVLDSVFGSFDYWWNTFGSYRIDRCVLPQSSWIDLLGQFKFTDILYTKANESIPYLIHCKKSKEEFNHYMDMDMEFVNKFNQIIIFGEINSNLKLNFLNLFKNDYQTKSSLPFSILNITNINQLFNINDANENNTKLSDYKSIIFNISLLNNQDENSNNRSVINQALKDYDSINQYLLNNNLKTKHCLITLNCLYDSKNYLNSSIIGSMDNWINKLSTLKKFNNNLYNFDFDLISLNTKSNLLDCLLKYQDYNQLIIRNNKIYNEKYKIESNNFNYNNSNNNDQNNIKQDKNINNDLLLLIIGSNNNNINNSNIIEINLKGNQLPFKEINNSNNTSLIYYNNYESIENQELYELFDQIELLSNICNNIKLNQLIIEINSHLLNKKQNNYKYSIFVSMLESLSNYKRTLNINTIFINNYSINGLSPIYDNLKNSNSNLNLNLLIFNEKSNLNLIQRNKLNYYFNENYNSSNIQKEVEEIIKKVFNVNEIDNLDNTIIQNFNLSNSSNNQFIEFKKLIDSEILKDSINLNQIKSLSINEIINTINDEQLKYFEFFRKKTND